jgi:SNF2 family DNA or RNA helicase
VEYPFKTRPYAHQARGFEASRDAMYFALWMEQRTGKSKLFLDTAAYNHLRGKIDAVMIVAPNGVHLNWAKEEIPTHWPESHVPVRTLVYSSARASTKSFLQEFSSLMGFKGCAVLCMNIEATRTSKGKDFARKFLSKRKVIIGVDESTDIKTPGSKQSRSTKALGRLAKMRRILTGTPGKPMEQYAQISFLSPHILDTTSYAAFKAEYGIWEPRETGEGKTYTALVGHRNINKLNKLLEPHIFRVTREEAFPNMPPKVYTKRFIELSREQRRMYKELRDSFITAFADGSTVTATHVLTRMLRLQQIACGYVPVDYGFLQEGDSIAKITEEVQPARIIPGPNPRLEALEAVLEDTEGKAIVYCRFRLDFTLIKDLLSSGTFVEYHGQVPGPERAEAISRFQVDPEVRVMLANPRAVGRGFDLSAADSVIYYSNYFGLETRQQSEDRAQSGKRTTSALYTDIVAEGTVDEKIIRALRSDQRLADMITGDPSKDWI